MELIVGIIGPAHGIKGEVRVHMRTDAVGERFALGSVLDAQPPSAGPLTVASHREYKGGHYVRFAEVKDRNGAEALRGVRLVIQAEAHLEDDAWYPHELTGLEVLDTEGYTLGTVRGVLPNPAHDLLQVEDLEGDEVLVPFVSEIVVEVDPEDNCVVLDPPGGLFNYEEEE